MKVPPGSAFSLESISLTLWLCVSTYVFYTGNYGQVLGVGLVVAPKDFSVYQNQRVFLSFKKRALKAFPGGRLFCFSPHGYLSEFDFSNLLL